MEPRKPQRGEQLVLASHNAGKLVELRALVAYLGLDITSAAALGFPEPEETGDSFHANAALKAHASAKASGKLALSDDSGLVVPALEGAPGIYSARWAGPEKDFGHAMQRVAEALRRRDIEPDGTPAYFTCVLALAAPAGECVWFEGRAEGRLAWPPRGAEGFGYDPMFVPAGHTATFAEMPMAAKQDMSHRAKAFALFRAWLEN